MNKRVIAAFVFLIVITVGVFSVMPEAERPVSVNDNVKSFSLPDLEGKLQGIPEGKVAVLNFWATWCPPCRKEVPSMVELYKALNSQGLEIIAVSVDRNRDDVMKFVTEQGMNFTVLHDAESSVARQYNVFRYPESLIIDRNGVIRQHLKGAVEWMQPDFYSYIEKLLQEPVGQTPIS